MEKDVFPQEADIFDLEFDSVDEDYELDDDGNEIEMISVDGEITEAKSKSDNGESDYMDAVEFDIQCAIDTLTDTGKWYHTSKNGGDSYIDDDGVEQVASVPKDEDEEEAGYYVFYGRDMSSMMAKANEVAKRIKDKFNVDIIITPGKNMVELEIPANIDLDYFHNIDGKGGKKPKKVSLVSSFGEDFEPYTDFDDYVDEDEQEQI